MDTALSALQRIAVFRALQLGDMLCAMPALRALRRAAPNAQITLIGLPWAVQLLPRFGHLIDRVLVLPGFPGLPEIAPQVTALPGFLSEAQHCKFDLAIQLHGSGGLTNPLVALLGAKRVAGFYPATQDNPDATHFMVWSDSTPEVLRCLELMQLLGAGSFDAELEFPLDQDDFARVQCLQPALPAAGSYVCIHPGSQLPSRRWAAQRFAKIGDRLHAAGLPVVLSGTAAEISLCNEVASAMCLPPLNLAGKTDLGAFAALVQGARLVVANDTAISHLAAALATPSVIVSCGSDPQRWAPLDLLRHHVLAVPLPCRPCSHAECPIGHPCADRLGVEAVAATVDAMLEKFRVRRHA